MRFIPGLYRTFNLLFRTKTKTKVKIYAYKTTDTESMKITVLLHPQDFNDTYRRENKPSSSSLITLRGVSIRVRTIKDSKSFQQD